MAGELPEVQRLRLKLKAARGLLRELAVAVAQAEEALERQARNPQPKEAQGVEDEDQAYCAVA